MSLFSPETAAKPHGVGPYLAEKGTCTISIWLRDQNYGGQQSLEAAQILCDTELVPEVTPVQRDLSKAVL